METPEWVIAALFFFSLFQWMGNIRYLWFRFVDAMDGWAEVDKHPKISRPIIRSEAEIKADMHAAICSACRQHRNRS